MNRLDLRGWRQPKRGRWRLMLAPPLRGVPPCPDASLLGRALRAGAALAFAAILWHVLGALPAAVMTLPVFGLADVDQAFYNQWWGGLGAPPTPPGITGTDGPYSRTFFAGALKYTGTKEQRISACIADAAAFLTTSPGPVYVLVSASMLPYDPKLVTFNTSVRVIREGSNPAWFDVLAYGAGVDTTTAFSTAILTADAAGGGVVWAPDGTYPFTALFTITNKTKVRIQGSAGAVIDLSIALAEWRFQGCVDCSIEGLTFSKPDSQSNLLTIGQQAAGCTRFAVRTCRFTTTSSTGNQNVASVGVYDSVQTLVQWNYIEYTHIGIINKFSGATDTRILENYCLQKGTDTGAEGLKIDQGVRAIVSRNTVVAIACLSAITWESGADGASCEGNIFMVTGAVTASYGIRIESIDGGSGPIVSLAIIGNTVLVDAAATITAGIWSGTATTSGVLIEGNVIRNAPIRLEGGTKFRVVGNAVFDSTVATQGGIALANLSNSEIVGNTVRGCAYGIVFKTGGVNGVSVIGNTVADFTAYGLIISKCSACVVKDNHLQTSSGAAIYAIWAQDSGAGVNLSTQVLNNHIVCTAAGPLGIRVESCDGVLVEHNYVSTVSGNYSMTSVGAAVRLLPMTAGVTPLVDAATIASSATDGPYFTVTLGGNRTMGAPSNATPGARMQFTVIQDGTGGRTLNWATNFPKFTWSDAGNTLGKRSTIAGIFDGTNWNQDGTQTPYV